MTSHNEDYRFGSARWADEEDLHRTNLFGARGPQIGFWDQKKLRLDSDAPMLTIGGTPAFCETFFENVRVPKANLMGRENEGWTVAKYLLEFERGGTYSQGLKRGMEKVRQISAAEGTAKDDVFRKKMADADVLITAMEMTELRILGQLAGGQNPGPESSLIKCRGSELQQLVSELAFEAAGSKQAPFQPIRWGDNEPPIGPAWASGVGPKMYNYRKVSIFAGSNEVQRGIMAKLILGL